MGLGRGGSTSREGGQLVHLVHPPKWRQFFPPPPWVGQFGRLPFPVMRARGGNFGESGPAVSQGGEDIVSACFGRCAVCVGGGGWITLLTPLRSTTCLPNNMSDNDAAGKSYR